MGLPKQAVTTYHYKKVNNVNTWERTVHKNVQVSRKNARVIGGDGKISTDNSFSITFFDVLGFGIGWTLEADTNKDFIVLGECTQECVAGAEATFKKTNKAITVVGVSDNTRGSLANVKVVGV